MTRWNRAVVCALGIVGMAGVTLAASSVNVTNKWAWSAGAGWINCRPDSTNGAVVGEFFCSGYMYSPTAGWIHLGNGSPSNGVSYENGSTNDYGVNHDGKGHLTGYAWCPSTGWINFGWTNNPDATQAPKIDIKTGMLSGYAWGGSLGWISLSNLSGRLQTDWFDAGTNADSDGLPDAWEISAMGTNNLGALSASGDYDDDGANDYAEYVAGTSPTNPYDVLEMTSFGRSGSTNLQVEWSSRQTRLYKIEQRDDLMDTNGWQVCPPGVLSADSDSNSVRLLPVTAPTQTFYRVKAVLPPAQ